MRLVIIVFIFLVPVSSYSSWFDDMGCDDSEELRHKSRANDAESLFKLGYGYSTGCKSYDKNPEKGRDFYIKSAAMGYGLAQLNLGILYVNRQSAFGDVGKALRWLRIADENGVSQAAQYHSEIYKTLQKVEPLIASTEGKFKIAQSIKNNKKDFYLREDLLLGLSSEYESQKDYEHLVKVLVSLGTMNFNYRSFVSETQEEFGPYAMTVGDAEKYYRRAAEASKVTNDVILRVDPLFSLSIFYRSNGDVDRECKALGELYAIYQANINMVGNSYMLMRPDSIERYRTVCKS